MREVKFRGYSLLTSRWIYGAYYKHLPFTPSPSQKVDENEYEHLIIKDSFSDWQLPRGIHYEQVNPESVSEFTGLKDSLDNDIFEGDILTVIGKNREEFTAPVVWRGENGLPAFILDPKYVSREFFLEDGVLSLVNSDLGLAVVVMGNVYENPELLEVNKNAD
ncbi:MAG: YopX family protein [Lactobacillus sp.]|jgi:hypothetical protein|nr:YopX family protein [Lactobacillus sp.]